MLMSSSICLNSSMSMLRWSWCVGNGMAKGCHWQRPWLGYLGATTLPSLRAQAPLHGVAKMA
eukprot:3801965-Amphidinium_carterae.1